MYEINENEPPEAAAVIFDQIYSNVWTASIESEASSRDTYPSKNRLYHGKKREGELWAKKLVVSFDCQAQDCLHV